ncbi:hypothetical protein JYU34_015716 [Plutella xylostella]|uniref:Uncharacterized protein n=1 Tax=Plutella xylostella TaxID=51655 RepID=A0ABQ7Q4K2_PLUXY|nr:hypothetical protein JYU34_015716 [Plutella xylostella]
MHFKPCRSQRAGGAGRVARGVARYVKSAAREGRGVRSGGLARSAVALCNRARRRRRRIERDARTPRPHSARGARPAGRAHCGAPMLTTCGSSITSRNFEWLIVSYSPQSPPSGRARRQFG